MSSYEWALKLRWVFWAASVGLILLRLTGVWKKSEDIRQNFSKQYFHRILFGFCFVYFLLGCLAKYSQLLSFQLSAQDFWLFTDMLEQMQKGGFFLTRFAPQSLGFVQHGSVHPMYFWAILTPFAAALGSLTVALIFNPLVLSLAGGALGVLARRKVGEFSALLFSVAFLASTQVGKILMYEVHPEAAYPLMVFLTLWALGLDGSGRVSRVSRVRWKTLLGVTLLCVGIKEDAFLVLGPWALWGVLFYQGQLRKGALSMGVGVALGSLIQILLVKGWVAGELGPTLWQGSEVITGAGVGLFKGAHWSGMSGISEIFSGLFSEGLLKPVLLLGQFLVSRPWISLLIFAPWVVLQARFWFLLLPLASVYAQLDGARILWTYYSAPLLGSFWFSALSSGGSLPWKLGKTSRIRSFFQSNDSLAYFSLVAALTLGGSGLTIYMPSHSATQARKQASALFKCVQDKNNKTRKGLVSSLFLGGVPLSQVWTDRVPQTQDQWEKLDFLLLSTKFGSFELPLATAKSLVSGLRSKEGWMRLNENCQVLAWEDSLSDESGALLFVKDLNNNSLVN